MVNCLCHKNNLIWWTKINLLKILNWKNNWNSSEKAKTYKCKKLQIRKYLELNNAMHWQFLDAAKVALSMKFLILSAYIRNPQKTEK